MHIGSLEIKGDSTMYPILPEGIEDFKEIRETRVSGQPLSIADKSTYLKDIVETGNKVILVTRPPRFMKTSFLSMSYYFLSLHGAEENKRLFERMEITRDQAFCQAHQGKYPVISITLKGVTSATWASAIHEFKRIFSNLYQSYDYLLGQMQYEHNKNYFNRIIDQTATQDDLEDALVNLTQYLHQAHQQQVIVLIDEYDTPLHYAHKKTSPRSRRGGQGYFGNMVEFITGMLGKALKTNDSLAKGMMTGVLRTAFTSILSGLNNPGIFTMMSSEFAGAFGLTQEEIDQFLSRISAENQARIRQELSVWYNGYIIGGKTIYNPWSVAHYFKALRSGGEFPANEYWVQSGHSKGLIEYLYPRYQAMQSDLGKLISGKEIEVEIDERTTISDLSDTENMSAFWGLLLHTGYLCCTRTIVTDGMRYYKVKIPNHEVLGAYKRLRIGYDDKVRLPRYRNVFLEALFEGNILRFCQHLQEYFNQSMSYYDVAGNSEQSYHQLISGIFATLHGYDGWRVRSNRESGSGRYDMLLFPTISNRSGGHAHGYLFEFKHTSNRRRMQKGLTKACHQIMEKQYYHELISQGIRQAYHVGMIFCGKTVQAQWNKCLYTGMSDYSGGRLSRVDAVSQVRVISSGMFPQFVPAGAELPLDAGSEFEARYEQDFERIRQMVSINIPAPAMLMTLGYGDEQSLINYIRRRIQGLPA